MHHYTGSYVLGIASRAAIAELYLSADNQHPSLNYSVAGLSRVYTSQSTRNVGKSPAAATI